MKKTLLVTTILASLVPTAQATVNVFTDDTHQVDLYGRAYGAYIYQDGKDAKSDGRSDSYFRTGFKASSNLSDDLTALAHIELQFESRANSNDAATASKTRLIYAGLQSDWAKLTFGRNYAADEIIADWADAGTTNYSGNPAIGNLNRQTNILKFEAKMLGDALNLVAHVQPESNEDGSGTDSQSSYAVGGVFGFDFGLELGATYTGVMTEDYTADLDYDRSTILVAARYKLGGLTVSVVGDSTTVDTPNNALDKNSDDWIAYEASLAYAFDNLTGTVTYKQRDTDTFPDNTVDQTAFGLAYQFNKNFRIVTEYAIIGDPKLDGALVEPEDQLHMAARYDF